MKRYSRINCGANGQLFVHDDNAGKALDLAQARSVLEVSGVLNPTLDQCMAAAVLLDATGNERYAADNWHAFKRDVLDKRQVNNWEVSFEELLNWMHRHLEATCSI